jgi:ribokinase
MIAVFGSLNVDLVVRVPRLPRPGETVLAPSYRTLMGGKGANQAVAAARAAGGTIPVRMIGAVGEDGFGALCRENLAREGIDVSSVATAAEPTGCAFIQVDDAGENVITVASGANLTPTAAMLDGAALGPGDILVIQMETPFAETVAAAAKARAAGARVVANLAPVPPGLDATMMEALMPVIDILVLNEIEAAHVASALALPVDPPGLTARMLATRSGRTIITTLGGDGAVAATPSGDVLDTAAPRITPVDTTGAGDTFVGALAAFLAEGRELEEALQLACKAASLACLALGAQSAMPERRAILG